MATYGQFTAQGRASGSINPFRFVKVSGNNTLAQCAAITDYPVGVSDGGNREFDVSTVAVSGEDVPLQTGKVVLITLAATLSAGAYVASDANGKAQASTPSANDVVAGVLLVGGDADEVVPMVFSPFKF